MSPAKCGRCKLQNTCSYDDMIRYGADCRSFWPEKTHVRGRPKRDISPRGGA